MDTFRLDGTGRLLDLGCGTGQLAIPLARHFEEVIGMDPNPEMLAEARALAQCLGTGNVDWIQGSSEDLGGLAPRLGGLRLVTMGSSFHWMDQDATLKALAELVVPDGGIAITGFGSIPWNKDDDWQDAIKTVIRRWLGEARRAGSSTYAEPEEPFEDIIARSAFKRMEVFRLDYQRTWSIEAIIGYLYSTSFCSRHVLGDKAVPFESDLRDALLKLNPAGQFIEDVALKTLLAWRE